MFEKIKNFFLKILFWVRISIAFIFGFALIANIPWNKEGLDSSTIFVVIVMLGIIYLLIPKSIFKKQNKEIFVMENVNTVEKELIDQTYDIMEENYRNSSNYPLYQQEYYKLKQEICGLNTKEELDNFYTKVLQTFEDLKDKYNYTDLQEQEKDLMYYKNDRSFESYFFDSYFKLLRGIGNKYKKLGDIEKAFDIFGNIVSVGINQMKQNFDVIDALRITDVRFFMKKFTKKKNEEDYKALEKFEEELIQYYRNKQLEEIEYFKELGKQGFFEFKKQASELGVVGYKKVITQDDDNVCEICKENEKVGRIPLNVKFPSGHLYYPFCSDCRCSDDYSLVNPETGLLYD